MNGKMTTNLRVKFKELFTLFPKSKEFERIYIQKIMNSKLEERHLIQAIDYYILHTHKVYEFPMLGAIISKTKELSAEDKNKAEIEKLRNNFGSKPLFPKQFLKSIPDIKELPNQAETAKIKDRLLNR